MATIAGMPYKEIQEMNDKKMAMMELPFSNGRNFLKVGSAAGPRISTG